MPPPEPPSTNGGTNTDGVAGPAGKLTEGSIGSGVGHQEVSRAEGVPVDRAQRPSSDRAFTEPLPILDERVIERDHCVEDDRPTMSLRRRQVELSGVADDQRVHGGRDTA
jgi:hypothetical protein